MIHEVVRELSAALVAKKCPIPVADREGVKKITTFERIVVEHDDDAGDSFSAPRSVFKNPKQDYTRTIGAKATIYAQASADGASEFEHRRRAEKILDVVLGGMRLVSRQRRNAFVPTSGAFVPVADGEKSDRRKGAVYELKFTFDRGVERRNWANEARPQASVAGFGSTTKASMRGADDDGDPTTVPEDAETACGA
jgi:hypothetical protein